MPKAPSCSQRFFPCCPLPSRAVIGTPFPMAALRLRYAVLSQVGVMFGVLLVLLMIVTGGHARLGQLLDRLDSFALFARPLAPASARVLPA
eukprot:6213907-Pleurochrysis_carterae.AAC.6